MPFHDASTILEPYRPGDEISIRQLLTAADLDTDDLLKGIWPNFVVLRINDRIAGAAAIQPCSPIIGLLRSVVLDPKARQLGLGRMLVEEAENLAQSDGLRDIFLLTHTAAPFFTHLGYRPIARREASATIQSTPEFQQLCPDSAVVMRKMISLGL